MKNDPSTHGSWNEGQYDALADVSNDVHLALEKWALKGRSRGLPVQTPREHSELRALNLPADLCGARLA